MPEWHRPYRMLSVGPKNLKILQEGVENFISINLVTGVTQEMGYRTNFYKEKLGPKKHVTDLLPSYKTQKTNNIPWNKSFAISLRKQGQTMSYTCTATAIRRTSSKHWTLCQRISWRLTGAVRNDSPPSLNGGGKTVLTLKAKGWRSPITDVARYEELEEAANHSS